MNKEKIQNKDVFVADFAGYLIDFIMKLFRIIFKGKEISRQGAHAFALFILTVSILYPNTTFPDNLIGFLKIYGVSFLFFSYFMIDALQNFDRIDRILRKFQQKTDLAYEDIINDVVTGDWTVAGLPCIFTVDAHSAAVGNLHVHLHKQF